MHKLLSTSFIGFTALSLMGCGTTTQVRALTIPVREDLRTCTRLAAVEQNSLQSAPDEKAVAEAAASQSDPLAFSDAETSFIVHYVTLFLLRERGAWMGRDIAQTGQNYNLCREKEELVALIDANNEHAR